MIRRDWGRCLGRGSFHRLPGGTTCPATLFALLVSVGSACNDARYSDRSSGITPQRSPRPLLSAVMVRTEFAVRAGTPVSPSAVLSILQPQERGMSGVVINGYPGRWSGIPGQALASQPAGSYPRLELFWCGAAAFPSDDLSCQRGPAPGDFAWIAGFLLPADESNLSNIWHTPLSVVRARFIERPHTAPPYLENDTVWLIAPPGEYRGFLGGPVGLEVAPGRMCAVAVVVAEQKGDDPQASVAIVARLIPQSVSALKR